MFFQNCNFQLVLFYQCLFSTSYHQCLPLLLWGNQAYFKPRALWSIHCFSSGISSSICCFSFLLHIANSPYSFLCACISLVIGSYNSKCGTQSIRQLLVIPASTTLTWVIVPSWVWAGPSNLILMRIWHRISFLKLD